MDGTNAPVNLAESSPMIAEVMILTFMYTNWCGIKAYRTVKPIRLWEGSTEHHPDTQLLLKALDVEKQEERDFVVKDISPEGQRAIKALFATAPAAV